MNGSRLDTHVRIELACVLVLVAGARLLGWLAGNVPARAELLALLGRELRQTAE